MSLRVERAEAGAPAQQNPEASVVAIGGPSDVAAAMLECILRSRSSQNDTARADIERAHELLERAREDMLKAMERADQADSNGDFWGDVSNALGSDVASIAGVVAAVSLAVATGGAGTPAILALAAAGMTLGAKAGQELGLDGRVTAAMGMGGAVLGLLAGNATGAGNAWTTLAQVSSAVQGGASGAGGGASIAEGEYRGDAVDARADAKEAQNQQTNAWLRLDLAIEELDRACREVTRAKQGVSNVQATESEGNQALITRIGAA